MTLELAVNIIYETVRYSWLVSALSIKYILGVYAIGLISRGELSLGNYLETVQHYARPTVTGIITIGFILAAFQVEIDLYFEKFTQLIALFYYAFLFWRY